MEATVTRHRLVGRIHHQVSGASQPIDAPVRWPPPIATVRWLLIAPVRWPPPIAPVRWLLIAPVRWPPPIAPVTWPLSASVTWPLYIITALMLDENFHIKCLL